MAVSLLKKKGGGVVWEQSAFTWQIKNESVFVYVFVNVNKLDSKQAGQRPVCFESNLLTLFLLI